MGDPFEADAFSPHVGQVFSVAGREDRLTLVSIERGRPIPGMTRQPFMLFFEGPRDRLLPEGTYALEGEGGVRFELYVMPIMTPPGDRQDYQVVVN